MKSSAFVRVSHFRIKWVTILRGRLFTCPGKVEGINSVPGFR
jgi:hypothetical protein